MRRAVRVLKWLLVLTLVLAVGAGGYGVLTVRASWPQTSGEVGMAGIDDTVRILRDARGIPQIYASTDHDLFFAQGYTHAQDRFWEMDFRRHVTAGRLSELFGKSQLDTDKFLRTLGWRRIAEQEAQQLKPETMALLQAYADGVNQWMREHRDARSRSLEYAILGLQVKNYEPEPWNAVDSIAWLKAMAWDLRGNLDEEMGRTLAASAVGQGRAAQLYPMYPFARHAPIVTAGGVRKLTIFDQNAPAGLGVAKTMGAIARLIQQMPAYFGTKVEGVGSNSWAVAGKYTDTGKPLLANDPHLSAMMPSIWTQVGLHCERITSACSFDVAGWSFSGFPGVIIGHNARVGWGFTNLGPDVTDLVIEKTKGNAYEVDGAARPIKIVSEMIKVAGGKTVEWLARSTEHGPLISDVSTDYAKAAGAQGNAVALRWTALTPGNTADAVFALNRASDWSSFRAAARAFEVPSQNLLYADVDGNIGYQSPGRIPIRSGYDGRWPVPGWDSKVGWIGYIPFDALPSVFNPRDGFIVTANQAVIGPDYPYHLTDDWAYGARSERIRDVIQGKIDAGGTIDAKVMRDLQMDARSEIAEILVPVALQEAKNAATAALRHWQSQGLQMAADSQGAAVFASFWRHLVIDTFRDELPKDYAIDGHDRWFEVMRWLVSDPSNKWWDDVRTTDVVETRTDMIDKALAQATEELGITDAGVARGTWGDLHTLTLTNQTFGKSGIAPIERLFNRGPVGVSGSSSVVLATGWPLDTGYEVDWLPSMRQVLDLSNWDHSSWVNLTGQSGHAYSAHYVDQFDAWVSGRTYQWPFSPKAVQAAAKDTLIFTPVPSVHA